MGFKRIKIGKLKGFNGEKITGGTVTHNLEHGWRGRQGEIKIDFTEATIQGEFLTSVQCSVQDLEAAIKELNKRWPGLFITNLSARIAFTRSLTKTEVNEITAQETERKAKLAKQRETAKKERERDKAEEAKREASRSVGDVAGAFEILKKAGYNVVAIKNEK